MKLQIALLILVCSIFCTCNANGQIIDADSFEHALKLRTGTQLLDIRSNDTFNTEHLPNAVSADIEDKESFTKAISDFDKAQPVYLYCANGSRSHAAAQWLRSDGFLRVFELSGGFAAWKAAGKHVEAGSAAKPVSDKEYMQMISEAPLVLIDFSAPWCPPCKTMQPVIDQLAEELSGDLKITMIDGGTQTLLMQDTHVNDMPGFILYRGGKEVWRTEGIISKAALEAAIQQYIVR